MKPLHWSDLRNMAKSAAHYKYALDNPTPITPAMRIGSLVHAMVLGKPRSFVVYDKDRRGNDWRTFKAANAGMEIVTAAEWDLAMGCADAVKRHDIAWPLIQSGEREQKIEWDVDGRPCAGTPDSAGVSLVDLKVTYDSSPCRFPWHAQKMGYPAQLAWYLNGLESIGHEILKVSIVAVEKKPPHVVTVFDLTEDALDIGRLRWRELFGELRKCEETGIWPGYVQAPVPLDSNESLDLIWDEEGKTT